MCACMHVCMYYILVGVKSAFSPFLHGGPDVHVSWFPYFWDVAIYIYIYIYIYIRRPLGVAKACEKSVSCSLPLLVPPHLGEMKGGGPLGPSVHTLQN